MRDELRALRGLMENQLNVLEWDRLSRRHPNRVTVLSRLTEMDIGTELARKLVADLRDERDLERSWRNVLAELARQVPISDDDFMQRGGVVALVGATGVGKTTTTANLGAALALQGKRCVVVDLDPQASLSLHLGYALEEDRPSSYRVLTSQCAFAEALVDTAIEHATDTGAEAAWLLTTEFLHAAIAVYEAVGFRFEEPAGEPPDLHGTALVAMKLRLE